MSGTCSNSNAPQPGEEGKVIKYSGFEWAENVKQFQGQQIANWPGLCYVLSREAFALGLNQDGRGEGGEGYCSRQVESGAASWKKTICTCMLLILINASIHAYGIYFIRTENSTSKNVCLNSRPLCLETLGYDTTGNNKLNYWILLERYSKQRSLPWHSYDK